ncbi:hypothetical protein GW17_00021687 [Ensete ventricosum]|nr:hypothetical protein GW17_00021687 [Ensete ventricosum]
MKDKDKRPRNRHIETLPRDNCHGAVARWKHVGAVPKVDASTFVPSASILLSYPFDQSIYMWMTAFINRPATVVRAISRAFEIEVLETFRPSIPHSDPRKGEEMILVAVVAELLEEYTAMVSHALEQLVHDAPFPRRIRLRILRNLPFASPPPPLPPPPHALRVRSRAASVAAR